ncbi:MAG: DUF6194 family protein [Acidimicrobiales bacterium]
MTESEIIDYVTTGDLAVLDTLRPHPVYGAQSWVSILNPGLATPS